MRDNSSAKGNVLATVFTAFFILKMDGLFARELYQSIISLGITSAMIVIAYGFSPSGVLNNSIIMGVVIATCYTALDIVAYIIPRNGIIFGLLTLITSVVWLIFLIYKTMDQYNFLNKKEK